MASKSKRRGRVFRASCILAALIIAGSSFAWFTSKDEVINRLSANADYDVSIVESFTPPKNWTPGQQVNKDVYALNSGTTPAYVNEDVSSKLTYTVEKKIKTWDADCVTLGDDKVDSIKAGAHLAGAFKPDGTAMTAVEIGNKLDPATGDIYEYFNNGAGTNPITTDDYTPTESGIYVFRRSIDVAADKTETFKYEGFYFDAGTKKYYKLADLKINEKTSGEAGDNIGTDGNLTKVPTVMYAKEDTQTVTPKLKYEPKVGAGTGNADDNHPQRLVATVNTNAGNPTAAQAGAVDSANSAVTNATDGKLKLLNQAKEALDTAYNAYVEAGSKYDAALTKIKYYAGGDGKTISEVTHTYVTGSTEPDNATALPTTNISAPGILASQITEYNSLVTDFNALKSEIEAANTEKTNADSNKSTKDGALSTAQSDFNTAKSTYNSQLGQDYEADLAAIGGTPATTDGVIYTVWAKEQAVKAAQADVDAAQSRVDAAVAAVNRLTAQKESLRNKLVALAGDNTKPGTIAYNVKELNDAIAIRDAQKDAAEGNGVAPNDYNQKKTDYENALAAYNTALKAYNDARAEYEAAEHEGHDITIYINLSDDVVTTGNTAADKWQLIPIVAGNAASDETAHFYYTGILEGGESSAKLIDSVELDKDVTQDAYKNFDFDLNINLDSVQVVYEDDQETLSTDPVTGEAAKFESRSANLTNPTSLDTPVLWN